MTAKELIKELQKVDANLPVVMANAGHYNFVDIEHAKVKKISLFELEEDDTKEIIDVVCLSRYE